MSAYLLPSIIHTKEFYTHIDYEFVQAPRDQVPTDLAQAHTHTQKFIINKIR